MGQLYLPEILRPYFGADPFAEIMQMQGKVFRNVRGRKTIQVSLGDKQYFVKQHFGVGWGEIFKNLFSLKKPVLGAMTEVEAIKQLDAIGIVTTPLIAYGVQGWNPAAQQSFLMTQDLGDIVSLEDLCVDWNQNPPDYEVKRRLLIALAELAGKLHQAGLCHRDFYLCHVVLKRSDWLQGRMNLILIDLHRMLSGQSRDGKAAMKDIAGLYFSAMDCGFDEKDWATFRKYYLPHDDAFWAQVQKRANKLYVKFKSRKFQQRLASERERLKTENHS